MKGILSALSLLLLTLFLSGIPASALVPANLGGRDLRLAIYQDGFAQVTSRWTLAEPWQKGNNTLRLTDLAATLDPTTLRLRSLTDPAASVTEQSFDYDTVAADRLLAKSIDQRLVVHTRAGQKYEGVLLSFDERQLVISADHDRGPVHVLNRGEQIQRLQFPALTQELLTRPVFRASVSAAKAGPHEVELSYLARGLRWRADYNLVLNADDTAADLHGSITIENASGAKFENAAVKLLAGEPKLDALSAAWTSGLDAYRYARRTPVADAPGSPGNDPSRVVGDYRVYSLDGRVTLADRQLKQTEFLSAPKLPVSKTYLFDGGNALGLRSERVTDGNIGGKLASKSAHVLLEIDNRAEKLLGVSLPRGKLRAYKRDQSGGLEFLGEDLVLHTMKDEKLVLHLGDAFDIVGERKQLSFNRISDRLIEEAVEVRIRNRKQEPVTVQVLERLFRGQEWEIVEHSHAPQPLDGRTVLFPVSIPADGEGVVTYRVRYQY